MPRPKSGPRPTCPRHPTARVWRDGTYGVAGHRRPRFLCLPPGNEPPHVFTETLPQQTPARASCGDCGRVFHAHEGLATPRNYAFPIRAIAQALVRIGEGHGYRETARFIRARNARLSPGGPGRRSRNRDAFMVQGWVEAFAPVVLERLAPKEWPEVLLLDHVIFKIKGGRGQGQGAQRQGFVVMGGARPSSARRAAARSSSGVPHRGHRKLAGVSRLPARPTAASAVR
jgi:hypothetical protein